MANQAVSEMVRAICAREGSVTVASIQSPKRIIYDAMREEPRIVGWLSDWKCEYQRGIVKTITFELKYNTDIPMNVADMKVDDGKWVPSSEYGRPEEPPRKF